MKKPKIEKNIPIPPRFKHRKSSEFLSLAEKMNLMDSVMFPDGYIGYKHASNLSLILNQLGINKGFRGTCRTIRCEKTSKKLGYRTWKIKS